MLRMDDFALMLTMFAVSALAHDTLSVDLLMDWKETKAHKYDMLVVVLLPLHTSVSGSLSCEWILRP